MPQNDIGHRTDLGISQNERLMKLMLVYHKKVNTKNILVYHRHVTKWKHNMNMNRS